MTINLKNQIVKYDTDKSKIDDLNLVQSSWSMAWSGVEFMPTWLQKVEAIDSRCTEKSPTVIVNPEIDASFFKKEDITSKVKVIGETTFWTSYFTLLLPNVKPKRKTYIRVYRAIDYKNPDPNYDEHHKYLEDICDDVDDFLSRLERGYLTNNDCCYSHDINDFAIAEIDPFLAKSEYGARTVWVYDNESGDIENSHPLHFANYEDLSCYMELHNSHGHLDQFPTHFIEPE